MTFQKIYDDALDEPAIGFKDSPKFRQSVNACPNCKGTVWIRIRFKTGSIIGARCDSCDWRTTFPIRPSLPNGPEQKDLPL